MDINEKNTDINNDKVSKEDNIESNIESKTESENIASVSLADKISEKGEANSNKTYDDGKIAELRQEILVSVIIPVYNACKHLRPAMDSILDQTLLDIEIICVDDGSTDTSLDMLKIYQKKDPRVRIITETNAGPGHARNNGLRRARGKYVAFLDADDFYELDMLEKLYNLAEEKSLDIALAHYDIYDNKKGKFIKSSGSEFKDIYNGGAVTSKNEHPDIILESTTGAAWNKLFLRSFLQEKSITFLPEVMIFEDVYFTSAALAFAERIAATDEILVHHRIYSQQARARCFKRYYNQVPTVFVKLKEFLMKGGMYQPLSNGFLNFTCSRCYHVFKLLKKADYRELFWNILHDGMNELMGWDDHEAGDFRCDDVCGFAANVDMYTYEQYARRAASGRKLNKYKLDQTLKLSKRRKRIRNFLVKIAKKLGFKKKDKSKPGRA